MREMKRIKNLIQPDYGLTTPTGVPDPDQQITELRFFAKEAMPHFTT
jgi:hypothetical protein